MIRRARDAKERLLAENAPEKLAITRRIATELAMRFAADALNERYFGWDRARFPAAGEHNLLRWLDTFIFQSTLNGELDKLHVKWLGGPMQPLPTL